MSLRAEFIQDIVNRQWNSFLRSLDADRSTTRAAEGPRPVPLRNAGENVSSVNATSQRAGVDPSTPAPAPTPIASVSVQASNGWFDISIADPSAARPGLFYFAESDTTPAFAAPRVYFMGASRNLYVQLGNQTLYWRAYSQYIGSLPSAPVSFGAPPAPRLCPPAEAAFFPTASPAPATASASIPVRASRANRPCSRPF